MANYTNTERMFYNLSKHRYILNPEAMELDYGISLLDALDSDGDIAPETLPERFLDRVSKTVYNYIYSWSRDKEKTEYVISLPNYRESIEEAMKELAYAWLLNNTDPSVYFTESTLDVVKVNPAVQTILINGNLITRGEYFNLPEGWKDRKGIDY